MKVPNTKPSFPRIIAWAIGLLSSTTLLFACHSAAIPEKPKANVESPQVNTGGGLGSESSNSNAESDLASKNAIVENNSEGESTYADIPENDSIKHDAGLTKASNCDAYRAYIIKTQALKYARSLHARIPLPQEKTLKDKDSIASVQDAPKQADAYTTTNLQEAGVDEIDILKSDGVHMYVIGTDGIEVLKAWPPLELNRLTKIAFPEEDDMSFSVGKGLLLLKKRLIVFRTKDEVYNDFYPDTLDGVPFHFVSETCFYVDVYDVTKPEAPVLLQSSRFDGDFKTARSVDDRIYVVMANQMEAEYFDVLLEDEALDELLEDKSLDDASEDQDDESSEDEALDDLLDETQTDQEMAMEVQLERQSRVDKALPIIEKFLTKKTAKLKLKNRMPVYHQQKGNKNSKHALLSCNDIYFPKTASQTPGLMSIIELSGDDFSQVRASAIADSEWLVYASSKNIYAVASSNNWFWSCYVDGFCKDYSHIHRFDYSGSKGHIQYANSGEVQGAVENPFWMSEYDGYLRVATGNASWDIDKGSSLTVLSLNGPELKQVGRIDGIAPGEAIFASRMFGDKGYLVTFAEKDPLFTLDLSDPKAPKIMGELKINGYSSYIHPFGEEALLTIGRDADDMGNEKGLQLQIFDVSDMKNPTRTQQYLIATDGSDNASSSLALYDHQAFSFHEPSGLLVIPMNVKNWSHWKSGANFSGMLILKVTKDKGFKELGLIDHAEFQTGPDTWWDGLRRSRFMFSEAGVYDKNAFVYTLSDQGIKVSNVGQNSKEVARLAFEE